MFVFFGCNQKKAVDSTINLPKDSLSSYLTFANDFNLSIQEREQYTQKALKIVISQENDSLIV